MTAETATEPPGRAIPAVVASPVRDLASEPAALAPDRPAWTIRLSAFAYSTKPCIACLRVSQSVANWVAKLSHPSIDFNSLSMVVPLAITAELMSAVAETNGLTSGSEALKSDFKDRLVNLRRIRPIYVIVAVVMPLAVMCSSIWLSLLIGQSTDQFQLSRGADLLALIRPHYARADDEGRTLIQSALMSSGDLQPTDTELRITLNPLSSLHRTEAIRKLCAQLNATNTIFPGSKLRIVYDIKEHGHVSQN